MDQTGKRPPAFLRNTPAGLAAAGWGILLVLAGCAHAPLGAGRQELTLTLHDVRMRNEGIWQISVEYAWTDGQPLPGPLMSRQSTGSFDQTNRFPADRPRGIARIPHRNVQNLAAVMGKEGDYFRKRVPPDAAGRSGSVVRFAVFRDGRRVSNTLSVRLP